MMHAPPCKHSPVTTSSLQGLDLVVPDLNQFSLSIDLIQIKFVGNPICGLLRHLFGTYYAVCSSTML
jgi:hypothetical protein